jgi:beta-aspartyl-peptidase (threonine type)
VREVLERQVSAWNEGNIDGFMETYWRSEALTFSSGGNTTRGWQATRDHYHERYPDRATMGQLRFSELEFPLVLEDVALVLGRWKLTRDESISGNFSLVLRRLDGSWKIVHDHTSSLEVAP